MNDTLTERIHVDGIVQGVGFRPFVYRLAHRYELAGWVRNNSQGVDIEVTGPQDALDAFAHALETEAPPLARVRAVTRQSAPGQNFGEDFRIITSQAQSGFTLVSPDVATCPDCLRELFAPGDRRYRYPFINCTNCGPRFSIIRELPYDRPHTTMAAFAMCPACQAEYDNPLDRRFHAQPNACPQCGPHVWFESADGALIISDEQEALIRAASWLREGHLLAIKGLGGFHLACDATNAQAVTALRQRKTRPHKPLAMMMKDVAMVRAYCHLSAAEETLLSAPAAPIVLLTPRPDVDLAANIAPGQRTVGVMLPYTPLHHILLHDVDRPLVMTSGNRQNEPIARTNQEARTQLSRLVDGFLWHNRPIHNRVDDSVWMVAADGPFPVRRSRGEAPRPIELAFAAPHPVLAAGSQMKNTFCLLTGHQAFLSQNIGEMDYLPTWDFFRESVRRYQDLFGVRPQVIAHDMHPDFTLAALDALQELAPAARPIPIQHHHAHIAACLAENQEAGPVIGLALDGTGYGPDGTVWGGEVLIADLASYRRAGRWRPFPLPGGEAAIRQPLRIALGLLIQTYGRIPPDLAIAARAPQALQNAVTAQIEKGVNAPLTSSCGRLFDAVAALLGVRDEISYEGQAAIELETLAASHFPADPYAIHLDRKNDLWEIPAIPLIRAVAADLRRDAPAPEIAARFHATVIRSLIQLALHLREEAGLNQAALSGGCFQNRILLEGLLHALRVRGFEVFTHHQVPPNDGGLSLGQAVIAAHHPLSSHSHS